MRNLITSLFAAAIVFAVFPADAKGGGKGGKPAHPHPASVVKK